MIVQGKELALSNVVGKHYIVDPKDLFIFLESFREDLEKSELKIIGKVLVAIESPINAKSYEIEILAEVDKPTISKIEGVTFQSYFLIKNALHTRVIMDLEKRLPVAFEEMIEYVENNRKEIITPIINVLNTVENVPYVDVYVGINPYDE
ncbi:DUF5085 family protein [Listeria welshimeri]|uniref:DUF5085 family protein n=1 Tax=Listeria welshimeri TaxID=1643 RepID=UPI00188847C4|nr:DUF5085 family protein [Listeria welshimeri]MBF2450238.1 DUF5085 family protein [Listeria welshimeri]MBF2611618.1 DUF5085 family protein [Listeria welshimeri]